MERGVLASSVDVKPTQPVRARSPASGKEFDPLSTRPTSTDDATQSKVLSAFGISNDGVFTFLNL